MYQQTLKLNNNEVAAKINAETGEIKPIQKRTYNNIPHNYEVWLSGGDFQKEYPSSWNYLSKVLTATEYKAAHKLVSMAAYGTNSLQPINDGTPLYLFMEDLSLSKNIVKKVLNKLFYYGVYGKFEVVDPQKDYTKYWIVNPYLSFKGKLLSSDIAKLFEGTRIARAYRGEYIL